jgi:hypothetical protein
VAPDHLGGISLLLAEDREMPGMWMYLPNADHLVPVVTRGLSALASDFTCEDLKLSLPLEDYEFAILGTETRDNRLHYRIQMTPRSDRLQAELGFGKAIGWVRADIWTIVRAEYLDRAGQVFKTFTAREAELVQGIWTIKRYTMTNHRAQHETDAQIVSVRYGLDLPAKWFTSEALRGIGAAATPFRR